jgi:GMP synthase-like glutamine amidotransferase
MTSVPTVLVIQHAEVEPPAHAASALLDAGCGIEVCRVDQGERPPVGVSGLAGLLVLGGPMSARSDVAFPTRQSEIATIGHALDVELPTLAIGLGAHLLAAAAGGQVIPGDTLQVGWGEVELTAEAGDDPLFRALPARLPVLHWHGETYLPPPGAVRLAGDGHYTQQATRFGRRAWGLQFHIEAGLADVRRLASAFPREATAGGGTATLTADTERALPRLRPARDALFAGFAAEVVAARTPVAT